MRNKHREITLVILLAFMILCSISIYYTFFHNSKSATTNTSTVITVKTLIMHKRNIEQNISSYAKTIMPSQIQLQSQIEASIIAIHFNAGETVKKGQLLFELKPTNIENQLMRLKAKLELSQEQFKRLQQLNKLYQGGVSTIDLIQAKTNYQQDLAQLQDAQSIYRIVSPCDGVISDTLLATGDFVQPGTQLAIITPKDKLQLIYQLPSTNKSKLKVGQKVIFHPSSSDMTYVAHVSYIADSLDADTYNLQLRADFAPNTTLLANDFGQIEQILEPINHFIVQQNLIQTDNHGFYIYLLEDNKVIKQYITVNLPLKSGEIIINSGIDEGDVLITSNPSQLSPNEIVKAKL